MHKFTHRYLCLAGMAAYAAFASGLTGALHASLAHSTQHAPIVSTGQADRASNHDHDHGHHHHGDSHAPECPTCYQLASASNAAPSLSVFLPHSDDPCGRTVVCQLQLNPVAEILSSIAPRAPPLS